MGPPAADAAEFHHEVWAFGLGCSSSGRAGRSTLQLAGPSGCPLYIDLLPRLLRDRHGLSEASREGIAQELWEEPEQCQAWERAGTPVNLNRRFALIAEGRDDDRD